jgi:hypothetical protein
VAQGNVTMSPIVVVVGGVEYRMSPLTDRDHGELDNWVRAEYLEAAKLAAGEPGTEQYDAVMRIALGEAPALSCQRMPGLRIASTFRGVARRAWQGIRHNHPKVEYETLLAAFRAGGAGELREFRVKYEIVNDVRRQEDAPSADPQAGSASRSRSSGPSSQGSGESASQTPQT